MASRTLASTLLRRAAPRQSFVRAPRILATPHNAHLAALRRAQSQASAPASPKQFDYEAVKRLSQTSPQTTLIDVREPAEFEAGHIAGARNVPVGSQPEALLLDADEFEDRFGFAKPAAADELVFYCKAGVRSAAAAKIAGQAGFSSVGEYRGSWADWVANGGSVAR